MPRIPPALGTKPLVAKPKQAAPYAPRLWNAKRRVIASVGLPHNKRSLVANPLEIGWREHVSKDVVEFIDNWQQKAVAARAEAAVEGRELGPNDPREMSLSAMRSLIQHPSKFFSRPHNVPTYMREQTYFADFRISLMRTPNLPPKYAAFNVPLWFTKLDMKSYLKDVYNVDVVHIRSAVFEPAVSRKQTGRQYTQGPNQREKSKKKMTVQLVEPFEYPKEIKDLKPWEKKGYWKMRIAQMDQNREQTGHFKSNPNPKYRSAIGQQAREILEAHKKASLAAENNGLSATSATNNTKSTEGKSSSRANSSRKTTTAQLPPAWHPTWKSIPADIRAMGKDGEVSIRA